MLVTAMLAAALAAAACGVPFEVETPTTFVELEEGRYSRYDYRSTTADGVVLSVRALDNERRGTAEFWAEAVRNKLRDGRGYALLEEADVRARGGLPGKQLRFGRDESGHSYTYWVTVFVRHEGRTPRVWVIEAGGEQEVFAARREEIERTIASFEPR
jgi:hypothetical protein